MLRSCHTIFSPVFSQGDITYATAPSAEAFATTWNNTESMVSRSDGTRFY